MDQAYQQAKDIENRFRNYVDMSGPVAGQLRNEVQRLMDDIETKKNPASIENRVNCMIRLLNSHDDGVAFSHGENDDLIDRLEDLRNTLKRLR